VSGPWTLLGFALMVVAGYVLHHWRRGSRDAGVLLAIRPRRAPPSARQTERRATIALARRRGRRRARASVSLRGRGRRRRGWRRSCAGRSI
jgi:hypothetical protein